MLDGKVVLVTGASRGIGKEIACQFARNNAKVVINYLNNDIAAKQVLDDLEMFLENVMLYKADVSKYDQVKKMIDEVLHRWEKIDILVNNAGINHDQLFVKSREEDWQNVLNVNLNGVMNCCHCSLMPMLRNKYGRIINISSVSVNDAKLGQSYYAASKSAIISFANVLAKEVGRWNVTVNTIVPGLIESDMTRDITENEDKVNQELKKIPLRRIGIPSDIASMVLFLADEKADYITGSVINIDGGISA